MEVPPLPPAAHSFFGIPPREKPEWKRAAGAVGGNAELVEAWAGFNITTGSNRTTLHKATTRAERATSLHGAKMGSSKGKQLTADLNAVKILRRRASQLFGAHEGFEQRSHISFSKTKWRARVVKNFE